jgi:SM-20-related protein
MLNAALDPAELAQRYKAKLRLQIPEILDLPVAERLHQCLQRETPWGIVYNDTQQVVHVMQPELRAMDQQVRARTIGGIVERAKHGFQYLYHFYPILTSYQQGWNPGLFLHQILEGLNSEPFLAFIRQVTGISTLIKADAQATLYAPGHFLKRHDDAANSQLNRRVAYVLSMTKGWHPDYGAMLQFYEDEDNAVTDVFVPRFNTLSIFTVPQMHAVSYTAPFAPVGRFAVTGWFQDP